MLDVLLFMLEFEYGPAILITLFIVVPVCILWADGIDKVKEEENDD